MINSSIDTVVLLHNPSELKIAQKKFPQFRETLVCTLTPHVSALCDKEKIHYTPLEDFGFNETLTKLREEIHQNILKTIELADRITQKFHPEKPYISPYRASFRRLLYLFAGSRIRAHHLSSLIAKTGAKQIHWWGKPAEVLSKHAGNKTFTNSGSVEIALLKFQKWEGVDLIDNSADLKDPPQYFPQDSWSNNFKQNILRSLKKRDLAHRLNFYMKMLKTAPWDFLKSCLFSSNENILIENYAPFWLETCKLLLQRGHKVHPIKDYNYYIENWQSNNDALEEELYKSFLASKIFTWNKMDWTGFVFPLIRYFSSLVEPLRIVAEETENLIIKHRIKCLLTIGAHRCYKYSLIQGAKNVGAKITTFQHGGFGAYGGIFTGYDDLRVSDFHICPGPGDVQSHKNNDSNTANKCRALGFTNSNYMKPHITNSEETLIKASPKKHQSLLYITTQYYLNHGSFVEFEFPWSDSLTYKAQKIIFSGLKQLVENYLELSVILKLHPGEVQNNIPLMGKDLKNDRFNVIHKKPNAQNLIGKSDFILIDTPATTLIQAVATRKPLFILTSILKLLPEAKEKLIKRAVVRDDPQELIQALENYLLVGSYPADINNTEFLRAFSDPFGDGKLFERAADLVVEACSKSNLNA